MEGGFGLGHVIAGGLNLAAFAVVNAFGNIVGRDGKIVAGAVDSAGAFVDIEEHIRRGGNEVVKMKPRTNTTLVVVVANASLAQRELSVVARMATAGIARAIVPAFTPWDGDLVFAVSAGTTNSDSLTVGSLAAEATRLAIVDAVRDAAVIG
jgi:L-aminopeptidase/D-esterase-like protein